MQRFVNKFRAAFRGIFLALKELSFEVHIGVAILTVFAGLFFGLSTVEWSFLIIIISMVFAFETMNTAIEVLADKVEPDCDPMIKDAKDLAAAAVLWVSIAAVLVGILIFFPKVIALIMRLI